MELNPMQQVMLTVLLGPEDPTAWKRYKKQADEKRRYPRHKAKILARERVWKRKHPGRKSAAFRAWRKLRRETDPAFRFLTNMRSRIRNALKDVKKAGRTHELVGCPIPELRAHLEARFVPGMTWENYGPVWHCDHIKPCSRFNLVDPAQQRECFHFSNLQPLFAEDNIRKCDKWDGV